MLFLIKYLELHYTNEKVHGKKMLVPWKDLSFTF